MASKKSKSRFSDLVKFVPEEIEEPTDIRRTSGIQTKALDKNYTAPKSSRVEYEEPEFPEPEVFEPDIPDEDDIPEIETPDMEVEEFYSDGPMGFESDVDEIDSKDLASEIDIEESYEEEIEVEEKIERTPQNMQQPESKREFNKINETIILGNTTIKGDIITDTGIQIYGAVLGNIESGGRVQLVGKVEGDITGKSVYVTNTLQSGNINAETEVHIKEGCQITGDIQAEKVFLKGCVIGNISATGQVNFESGSEIQGNVSAHSFDIKPGAKINGSISTN